MQPTKNAFKTSKTLNPQHTKKIHQQNAYKIKKYPKMGVGIKKPNTIFNKQKTLKPILP
jgi:hypothetical protein